MEKRIVILGGGESGCGAAILANKLGFDVFLSDFGAIADKYKQMLNEHNIPWEECKHTKASQARELSGVKAFFNYLLINDKIEQSPTEMISTPKRTRHLPDVLTVEEVEQIIKNVSKFGIVITVVNTVVIKKINILVDVFAV